RGEDIVIVPDGPRGPRHEAKDGALQLARATGLPLVVVGAAAWPARRLGSWDRMVVPRPFARAALVLSAPLALPADRAAARAAVGELNAARPLLRRLRERFAERLCVVSTLSLTGLELARSSPEAHLALLLPLDAPGTVRRLLAPFQLEAFFFTETEIWPTLLAELAARGVPTFMVSGRVGSGTMRHARWLRPLYRHALAGVDCCMQSEEDVQRILALGADPRRVQVAGNPQFDGSAA